MYVSNQSSSSSRRGKVTRRIVSPSHVSNPLAWNSSGRIAWLLAVSGETRNGGRDGDETKRRSGEDKSLMDSPVITRRSFRSVRPFYFQTDFLFFHGFSAFLWLRFFARAARSGRFAIVSIPTFFNRYVTVRPVALARQLHVVRL